MSKHIHIDIDMLKVGFCSVNPHVPGPGALRVIRVGSKVGIEEAATGKMQVMLSHAEAGYYALLGHDAIMFQMNKRALESLQINNTLGAVGFLRHALELPPPLTEHDDPQKFDNEHI